jgi:hypothetical protein
MALTGNSTIARRGNPRGYAFAYGIMAAEVIYTGSLILVNAAGNVGRIQTIGSAGKFVGMAQGGYNNAGGAAMSAAPGLITAFTDEVMVNVTGATTANINSPVYASDDGTFTMTQPGSGFTGIVGYLIGIDQQSGLPCVQLSGH